MHKTLASVGKMTDAGNTLIFSKGKSIITSDKGGKTAATAISAAKPEQTSELEQESGVYTFDMWFSSQAENIRHRQQ